MKIIRCVLVLVVFCCFGLLSSSCSSQNLSGSEISSLVTLTIENADDIHKDQLIDIFLENKSDSCIEFPYNYGLIIYEKKDGGVKEINEFSEFLGEKKPIRVDAYNKGFDTLVISFYPDLSAIKLSDPKEFYAEINGYLCDDDSVMIIKTIPFFVLP